VVEDLLHAHIIVYAVRLMGRNVLVDICDVDSSAARSLEHGNCSTHGWAVGQLGFQELAMHFHISIFVEVWKPICRWLLFFLLEHNVPILIRKLRLLILQCGVHLFSREPRIRLELPLVRHAWQVSAMDVLIINIFYFSSFLIAYSSFISS